MKKSYTVLFSLLLAVSFALSGCGTTSGPNASGGSPESSAQNSTADRPSQQKDAQKNSQRPDPLQDKTTEDQQQPKDNTATTEKQPEPSKNPPKKTAKLPLVSVGHSDKDQSGKKKTDILDQMTLDEKIGQLVMVGMDGTTVGPETKTLLQRYHVGGIILYGKNIETPKQTVNLTNQLKKVNASADNPLPLFISVDQEGGRVERLPNSIAGLPSNGKIGQTDDPHFSYQVGQLIGKELNAFGFNMDFAPVLDVRSHSPHSVIGDRSFSSDKQVVSELGVATMKGIQSQDVVSVVKHFPGYGPVTVDAHKGLPKVDYGIKKLMNVEWYPYQKVIANGADTIMVTHMLLPKLDPHYPASMSQKIITGMLRDKLGFDGVIMTDDMTMGAIEKHFQVAQAGVRAVEAGADIVLVAFNPKEQIAVINALKQAVEDGDISKKQLNEKVSRIIELKQKYNLSDQLANAVQVSRLNREIKSVLAEKFS